MFWSYAFRMIRNSESFRRQVNEALESKQMTLTELASLSGVPQPTLSRILAGGTAKIKESSFQSICKALEIKTEPHTTQQRPYPVSSHLIDFLCSALAKLDQNGNDKLDKNLAEFGYSPLKAKALWMVYMTNDSKEFSKRIVELLDEVPADDDMLDSAMMMAKELVAGGFSARLRRRT